jgi:Nucleotidyl transferase AbiEii toxin, Type IV TA system
LRREVKLELGTLTDQQPTGSYAIKPLLADAFAQLFDDWSCQVTTLKLERTFWEKATILHAEFHRPEASPTPTRYARHYFDMAKLLGHPNAALYLAEKSQCQRVVDWKGRVFARSWARYELAVPGTFRLVPAAIRQAELAQDYATMRPMFMTEPPPFSELISILAHAEATLNAV